MKDIKTREHDRKPKVLEKASRMPKELAKEAGLAAKEKSLQGSRVSDAADHPDSPTGYAGDKVESVLKRGAKESGRTATKVSYAAGKQAVHLKTTEGQTQAESMAIKQACSAIGQARLMMTYQKLFAEYNQVAAQILMTKNTIVDNLNRYNAHNTFTQLLKMGAIPVVNENDTVATYEIEIGDNDTLSAIVAALIDADLLILLSDIDGLYTDDPRQNPNAEFIEQVDELTEEFMHMGKASTGSNVGTGGMNTKMIAAKIATSSDVDMIIANSKDIGVLHRLLSGENEGTLFVAHKDESFDLPEFVQNLHKNQ